MKIFSTKTSRLYSKTQFFIFLLLIICRIGFAQSENYIDYHLKINESERLILEEDYAAALDNYLDVFNAFQKPFAKDYYNAAICATYANKHEIGIILLKKTLDKGVLKKVIRKKVFKPLKESDEWDSLKKYQTTKKYPYHPEIHKEIHQLLMDDQKFRRKRNAYVNYIDTISKIDSCNIVKIINIIDSIGYPGNNKLGVNSVEKITTEPYIMIRHAYQMKNYIFSNILLEGVREGEIHPYVFAELEDKKSNYLGNGDKFGITAIVYIKRNKRTLYRSKEDIALFNTERKKIGLEPFDEYLKKLNLVYNKKTPFIFNHYQGIVSWAGISIEKFDEINCAK